MLNYFDFETIRPYHPNEFAAAWQRIRSNKNFHLALAYLFRPEEKQSIEADFDNFHSTRDFQLKIMHRAIRNILNKSSKGLSYEGFEHLKTDQAYTFIANHRDIFLDSGILQILLVENGLDTSEITFGSNLMLDQFIIDIGKVNKMFRVQRDGNRRELYENSIRLSHYMRHALRDKKQSTWIAQRNGRTKNGNDETQSGVLKMLFASQPDDFVQSFLELHLVPVCISYEFEPCDALKVQESYFSQNAHYTKRPGEDLGSILSGITEEKGRIHLKILAPIDQQLCSFAQSQDPFKSLCAHIDSEMYRAYQLFPNNFIAFDLLHKNNLFENRYSSYEKEFFMHYMQHKISSLTGEVNELQRLFLELYAHPVMNAMKVSVLKQEC